MIRPRPLAQRTRPRAVAALAPDRTGETIERDSRVVAAEWLIPLFAGCSIAIWLLLVRWYDLRAHYAIPYFAFEKLPGQFTSPILRKTLWLFITANVLYIGGCLVLARAPRVTRTMKFGVLAFVAGPALVCLWLFPVGALDVFNYMVDLKLAYHYHASPYVVTNPEWLLHDPITRSAFLLNVPLFYGPAWLALSGLPALVTGFGDVVHLLMGLKVLNGLLLGATALLIARAQPTERRRWLAPFVLLANPLVIFEGIGNAHNDVMMTVFLVAGVVAFRQSRTGWIAAPVLVISGLVKLFSFAAAPLFLLETIKRRWRPRAFLVGAIATAAITLLALTPWWEGSGLWRDLGQRTRAASVSSVVRFYDNNIWKGFREGARLGQRMDHVSPVSLAQQRKKDEIANSNPELAYLSKYSSWDVVPAAEQNRLHREFTVAFAALALLVLIARAVNLVPLARATALTLMLFALLMTNLYPWYLIPIIALLALELEALGLAYIFAASLLALAYYPAYVWAHFNTTKSLYQIHLFLAIFLTAPMLAFLALETIRLVRAARAKPLAARGTSLAFTTSPSRR